MFDSLIEEALERLKNSTTNRNRNYASGYCSGLLNAFSQAGLISREEWASFCRLQNKALAHAQSHGVVGT